MSGIITSDDQVKQQAIRTYESINVDHWLGLFQNYFTPRADTLLADFIPCTFAGYSPISLNNQFVPPTKQRDAEWISRMIRQTFAATADNAQQIVGFYIFGAGSWQYAQTLDEPLNVIAGTLYPIDFALQTIGLQLAYA